MKRFEGRVAVVSGAAQGMGGELVCPRRTAKAKVDPPRIERRQGGRGAPHLARSAHVVEGEDPTLDHFHRVRLTRVPAPGCEDISNSFDNRFAPPSPSPRPPPVE